MEKIIIANLKAVINKPVTKRQRVSVDLLRTIAARHAKVDVSGVKIDNDLLQELFKHGGMHPLHKIRVKLVTDEKGIVLVLPPEKKVDIKVKEKKPAKEVKPTEKKTEQKKEETEQPKPKFEQKLVEGAK